ncbi:P-loop containing nucleoside triphosphate hydrolase protein [Mycena rebaudengoi]|nr:P-loop containing nucleoside triphosphate hydrolase protein [Mycena rebaudengoi]
MDERDAFDALSEHLPAVNSREWLDSLLRVRCKVSTLWPHQIDLSMAVNEGKDVFCVVATGMGKTVILQAGALAAHARGENAIALIIVPTKVLVEQQADVATARGLRALAINEDTVRDAAHEKRDLWAELVRGDDVRVAIMTPQMALGRKMQQLLNSPAFVALIRWVSVDEAGLIDQKNSVFAPHYLRLSILRVKLLTSTQWTAVTASATTERAPIMAKKYGMKPGAYVDARYSINRPNLKYIPRFYQHAHTGSEHLDFSFVVPFGITSALQILLTVIFAHTIERGFSIMDFLDKLISPDIPNAGSLIKLYNSLMTSSYRRNLKADFLAGKVRVIIVTDTAAYGFDVPNVETGNQQRSYIAFAPSWVRNLPPTVVPSTKTGEDEEEKRAKLQEPIRAFFNPTEYFCTRHAILHYYSEPYISHDCLCAPIHDPDASNDDLARVQESILC